MQTLSKMVKIMTEANKTALEREYSPSSCVDDIGVFIDEYIQQSALMRKTYAANLYENLHYGDAPRAMMDVFVPSGTGPFPVHVFIHGGYWQALSKAESIFAAKNFLDQGIIFIALDYTLAPDANLAQITSEARAGALWVLREISRFGGDATNITMSGHSAGAHLLAEIIAMDWPGAGFETCPLTGAALISGVYDLRPLVQTYINDALGMSDEDAATASPLLHLPQSACPLIFTHGDNETDAFKQQTKIFHNALKEKGFESEYMPMAGFNHFDIILELADPKSPLFVAIMQQMIIA